MDEVFDQVSRTERRMATMLLYFAALAILIALLTVSLQSIRAGSANPSEALRYE